MCLETQPDWLILFWALLAAGRKPLLLDPMLNDDGLRHLLTQAGATALIINRRRDALGEYTQRTPQELTQGPFSKTFTPAWADRIALCTSGTTATSRVYVYDGRAACLQSIAFVDQQKRRYQEGGEADVDTDEDDQDQHGNNDLSHIVEHSSKDADSSH